MRGHSQSRGLRSSLCRGAIRLGDDLPSRHTLRSPGGAAHIRAVLGGQQSAFRDIVLLNAAAALLVAGKVKTLREGVALAGQSIDSGKAMAVLEALVKLSHDKV